MTVLTRRAALALPALLPATARAQDWRPGQPVRIIVPAAPGGTADAMARLTGQFLQTRWGTPAVVENRSGAGGTIGTMEVVRSAPDGRTMLLGNIGPQAIGYSLFRNLQYRPDSLAAVANIIRAPNVLVVHPSVPAQTVPEFVAWLKRENGRATYGTSGMGQSPHLSAVWFNQLAGTQAEAIHHRGAGPLVIDLIAGNVQFAFDNLTTSMEHIRSGRMRALGVTTAERSPGLPDVPAIRETMPVLAPYEVSTWFGVFVPAGTPAEIIRSVNADMQAMLALPETGARFTTMGGRTAPGTPEDFATFVRAEIDKWGGVIRREGLQMDAT
ncbi:tripartite tricarboxylate transporter substrate binding protein [Roseomonas terrae]|jgi:tripartite-type tricarboxylate transporter receptor subunit TctC|uniref:Tripartite tricarboxylate transporter substrate binding protein n=1 Tax=Neoroseomonas terrae TaxID=424799 RepID=A0ABS5EFF2_9PROT|nr:tripartite tricarboxylate transporter substrate binding protein [Neoroseomonas terrae]MBR0649755.1 tripartite tricarboxylate transporter substrate binding protein [Neoroseomonas terrae]